MGRKHPPGLYLRGGTWHIDKRIRGQRLCESTGESYLEEAEQYLARRIEQIRQASIYGVRPRRTFRQAATEYLNTTTDKATLFEDARHLKLLDSYIGDLTLEQLHMGTLQQFIADRKQRGTRNPNRGVKHRTINFSLQITRRILNLAANEWRDEHGLTWLERPPKITLLPEYDRRKPCPLSWEEQSRLFQALPPHLERMCLYKVNTGCREAEVCGLRWEWEVSVPELNTSVFIIPGERVKNRDDRLVVLNRVARSVIEEQRGHHPEFVFTWKGRPVKKIHASAWRRARREVGLPMVRVHDLKHTFGRRLRAAGVSFEDRQDLLGHRSGRITTHYSQADLENLIRSSEQVVHILAEHER